MSPKQRLHQAQEIEAILENRIRLHGNGEPRLPSETDLANEFGVSRVTIREALASLERRGLIFRKHGVGTFINHKGVNIRSRLEESIEFGQLISSANYEPELGFLDCRVEQANLEVATRLQLQPGEPVLVIAKVFKADGMPVIYCLNVIPLALLSEDQRNQVLENIRAVWPIYTVLERIFNQQIAFQISDVSACIAGEEVGRMLNCLPNTALLRLQDVGFNENQQAVFYADVHYIPGLIQFQLVRKPVYSLDASTL